jgi:hypothetical protein
MVSISFLLLCLLLCAKRDVCRVRWLEVFRTFPVFSLAVEMAIEFSFSYGSCESPHIRQRNEFPAFREGALWQQKQSRFNF